MAGIESVQTVFNPVYLSDKLGIPLSELNKENISSVLMSHGVNDDDVKALMGLLDKCEFAQYAPELADTSMKEVFDTVGDMMDKLETIKKK